MEYMILSCRAVEKIGIELVELIKMLFEGKTIVKKSHKTSGKLWIGKDWRPEHLRLYMSSMMIE